MTKTYRMLPTVSRFKTGIRVRSAYSDDTGIVVRGGENLESDDYYDVDTDIFNLMKKMVQDTPRNREAAFEREPIAQSSCNIVASTILGEGVKIKCDNDKARKIIHGWNSSINVQRQNIGHFYQNMYIDNVMHGTGYWRILRNEDLKYKIDIARIDPKTITPYAHSTVGWNYLVQETYKVSTAAKSEREFYMQTPMLVDTISNKVTNLEPHKVYIPDRPEWILKIKLFYNTPMTSALGPCVYKLWILWFIRKLAEKFYAPFLVGKVGDMEHMPDDIEELKQQIASLRNMMQQWRNFSGVALPGNHTIESVRLDYQNAKDIIAELEYLDENIGQTMGLPKAMVSAKGTQLAASRPIESSFLRTIHFDRMMFNYSMKPFYEDVLLPANGINDAEIEIDYGPLQWTNMIDLMQTIQLAKDTGVFKDWQEVRRAGREVYQWLEELDKSENISLKKLVLPPEPQPGGGQPFGGGGKGVSNTNKPNQGKTGQQGPQNRSTPQRKPQTEGQGK